jgi:pyrroline-5-carboxylate reductase
MKILFLGGGNMANALIGGMLKQGFAATDIHVIDPGAEARAKLSAAYAVNCHASADAAPAAPDLLVLAVKPQQMKEAVAPLVSKLGAAVVVSIAAGLDMAALSRWLGGHRKIVRCMPNTPALIGAGITGLCALPEVSAAEREAADRVLRAVGSTVWIADEAKMDGVTAISGSGPAYVFLFIEALQQAAAELGFTPEQGRQLAIENRAGCSSPCRPVERTRFHIARTRHLEGWHDPKPRYLKWPNKASRKASSPASKPPKRAVRNSANCWEPTDAGPHFPA